MDSKKQVAIYNKLFWQGYKGGWRNEGAQDYCPCQPCALIMLFDPNWAKAVFGGADVHIYPCGGLVGHSSALGDYCRECGQGEPTTEPAWRVQQKFILEAMQIGTLWEHLKSI